MKPEFFLFLNMFKFMLFIGKGQKYGKNKIDEDSYIMAVKCIVKIYNDIDYIAKPYK